jgi:hypothetical protein
VSHPEVETFVRSALEHPASVSPRVVLSAAEYAASRGDLGALSSVLDIALVSAPVLFDSLTTACMLANPSSSKDRCITFAEQFLQPEHSIDLRRRAWRHFAILSSRGSFDLSQLLTRPLDASPVVLAEEVEFLVVQNAFDSLLAVALSKSGIGALRAAQSIMLECSSRGSAAVRRLSREAVDARLRELVRAIETRWSEMGGRPCPT